MIKQLIDQSGHVAAGLLLALPCALIGAPVLGICHSLAFALYREFVKQRPVNSWADTLADLAFWLAGASAVLILL